MLFPEWWWNSVISKVPVKLCKEWSFNCSCEWNFEVWYPAIGRSVRIQVCYVHAFEGPLPPWRLVHCVPLSLDFNYSYSSWKLFQVFRNNLHSGNRAFQVLCPEERTTANKTRRKTLICSVISSHNLYTWAQVLFILVIRDKFVQQKHALLR